MGSGANAMSQTSSSISVLMPCPRHGLTLTPLVADACPRHVLHWLISQGRSMSQTCLILALVSMSMPCPRHGLTLALIMWRCMSQACLTLAHTSDPNVMA
ncbi:hypothetical protein F383_27530 [Gossypium arboreum]|uniref:Uncharacterized protein n=1 Tax=Gossypium arboreum TaxID=29729 RepID=A0A0B0P9T5_GOSAR|nr:hypothetical protein F383_27530 [Gossypium arboreum]